MQEQVALILKELKAIKVSASTAEKDLKFANGQLGQAAKGKSRLSEERLAKLVAYHEVKCPKPVKIQDLNQKTHVKPVTDPPPKTNYSIDTRSKEDKEIKGDSWWEQNRKKKLGLS